MAIGALELAGLGARGFAEVPEGMAKGAERAERAPEAGQNRILTPQQGQNLLEHWAEQ